MKPSITFFILCFLYNSVTAQTDIAKIGTEIKKLSGEYLGSFKNLRGAIKTENEFEAVYHSRLKLTGTSDSSNAIRFVKDRQIWSFTADFDKEKITMQQLDSLIGTIVFSFGKLKSTTPASWGNGYTPGNKKGAAEKIKCFFVLLYDPEKNHADKKGRLTFVIGEDDYYRNK